MSQNKLNKVKHAIIRAKVTDNVPDLSDHPFFVKKREALIAFLKEHPIPNNLSQKK